MTTVPQLPQNKLLAEEPAATVGTTTTVITLVINAVVSYGIPITPDMKLLIVFIIGTLGPLVAGFITRHHVFSPATVAAMQGTWAMVTQAAHQTPPTEDQPVPPTPPVPPIT